MRQIGRAVIAAGSDLEALGERLGVVRLLWRIKKMKRLEATGARFQQVIWGQRQTLGPAERIGIVKIRYEPEHGQDFVLGAFFAIWQICREDGEREVGIVMRPAGDPRDCARIID
jgi:hypothetical protein